MVPMADPQFTMEGLDDIQESLELWPDGSHGRLEVEGPDPAVLLLTVDQLRDLARAAINMAAFLSDKNSI